MWCKRMVYIVLQYHLMAIEMAAMNAVQCAHYYVRASSLRGASFNTMPKSGKRIMQLLQRALLFLHLCHCTAHTHTQSLYTIFGLLLMLLPLLLLLHRPQMLLQTIIAIHIIHWRGFLVAYQNGPKKWIPNQRQITRTSEVLSQTIGF